jgi:hypothetical protein
LVDSGEAISLELAEDFKKGEIHPASNLDKSYLIVALTDHSEQFENLSNELLVSVMAGHIDFETVSVT